MTEADWLECADPDQMLDFLRGKASDRKRRLLCLGCCYRLERFLQDPELRQALVLAGRLAEGGLSEIERKSARREALNFAPQSKVPSAGQCVQLILRRKMGGGLEEAILLRLGWAVAQETYFGNYPDYIAVGNAARLQEQLSQCDIIRCIFGNPFRPVTLDPRWQSSTVLDLARTIYDQRTFEHMPILADALMDAGCDNDEIIQHCQGPGPHVRGCWVVDLLTGRE